MEHREIRRSLMRFSELSEGNVGVEYHVHTNRTDGQHSIEEILHAARRKGITALAFTEHVRRETGWYVEFADEVRKVARDFPEVVVSVGCEAKVLDLDGTLDVSESILAEADIVLGSVHRIPDGNGGFHDLRTMGSSELADIEHRLSLGLLRNSSIDVLAHPGGMSQRFQRTFPTEFFRSILTASTEADVAVEISSSYLRDSRTFLDLCREINPRVSIGSDVHRLDALGSCSEMVRSYLATVRIN